MVKEKGEVREDEGGGKTVHKRWKGGRVVTSIILHPLKMLQEQSFHSDTALLDLTQGVEGR